MTGNKWSSCKKVKGGDNALVDIIHLKYNFLSVKACGEKVA